MAGKLERVFDAAAPVILSFLSAKDVGPMRRASRAFKAFVYDHPWPVQTHEFAVHPGRYWPWQQVFGRALNALWDRDRTVKVYHRRVLYTQCSYCVVSSREAEAAKAQAVLMRRAGGFAAVTANSCLT